MGKRLYVGNLSYGVTSAELQNLFAPFGTVVSADVIIDRTTNKSKGFGFVEMGTDEEAKKAVAELNGQKFAERTLTVSEAKPRPDAGRGYR